MNIEKFLSFLRTLKSIEGENGIQQKLGELTTQLGNLASQPQSAEAQSGVAKRLEELSTLMAKITSQFTPTDTAVLLEINATNFFGAHIIDRITDLLKANAITPTIVHNEVTQLTNQRAAYIKHLNATILGLDTLGVRDYSLEEGSAEVAFLVPRAIFSNELGAMADELKDINQVLNFFNEAVIGKIEPVAVRQLASAEPTFFLGLNIHTVVALAAAVTWLLNTWKQALEIKKLYNDGMKVGLTEKELKPIEERITKVIDDAIESKAKEITRNVDSIGRRNELENGITWALKYLMANIERGMTVQVRAKPPKSDGEATADHPATSIKDADAFNEVNILSRELSFPPPEGKPLLELGKRPSEHEKQ